MHPKPMSGLLLAAALALAPTVILSQVPIDVMPVKIFEILDVQGARLGAVVVAGSSSRGFVAGSETWRFEEAALFEIAQQESLELAVWAEGDWDNPWVVQALAWWPADPVQWVHPTTVEWTSQGEMRPPIVPGGTYFGNATVGGLTIRYAPRGPSSLTWFKLTEGAFMAIGDGAVLQRYSEPPATGSWWQGRIEAEQ
ncbi:MAG: hypothetical protein AAF657_09125 [Acidobacteriota bacterium]